jgi:hypothetical protein
MQANIKATIQTSLTIKNKSYNSWESEDVSGKVTKLDVNMPPMSILNLFHALHAPQIIEYQDNTFEKGCDVHTYGVA